MEHLIITFVILFSAGTVAIIYPSFYDAISLIGSVGCILICVTLPCLVYNKLNEANNSKAKKNLVNLINIALTLCGIISATLTLLKDVKLI